MAAEHNHAYGQPAFDCPGCREQRSLIGQEGNNNILRNLRSEYGERVAAVSDRVLLKNYNFWNQSDKSEPCIDWLLELDD